jgi:hypothetical protein
MRGSNGSAGMDCDKSCLGTTIHSRSGTDGEL